MNSGIFISYSRRDSKVADELYWHLKAFIRREGASLSVWMDREDIKPGEQWAWALEKAIKNCSTMVVLHSEASSQSSNVRAEWGYGLRRGKLIIPVVLEDGVELPLYLEECQFIDCCTESIEVAAQKIVAQILSLEIPDPDNTPTSPSRKSQDKHTRTHAIAAMKRLKGRRSKGDDFSIDNDKWKENELHTVINISEDIDTIRHVYRGNRITTLDIDKNRHKQHELAISIDIDNARLLNLAKTFSTARYLQESPPLEDPEQVAADNDWMPQAEEIVEQAFTNPKTCLPLIDLVKQRL